MSHLIGYHNTKCETKTQYIYIYIYIYISKHQNSCTIYTKISSKMVLYFLSPFEVCSDKSEHWFSQAKMQPLL